MHFHLIIYNIHQNPLKAKMVNNLEKYKWSSYNHYLLTYRGELSFIDAELIKSYFRTIDSFVSHMNEKNNDECLEYKDVQKYNDDSLKKIIKDKHDIDDLVKLPIKERNTIIKNLYNEFDVSLRQLSRVLGLGKTVIEKAIREDK